MVEGGLAVRKTELGDGGGDILLFFGGKRGRRWSVNQFQIRDKYSKAVLPEIDCDHYSLMRRKVLITSNTPIITRGGLPLSKSRSSTTTILD